MKKLGLVFLALCLTLGLFAGCQTDPPAPAITSADDLPGKSVGVQTGTTGDLYVSEIEGVQVERFNNGMEAVMALKQDKIDGVVIDDQPARVYVAENDDLMILEEPFETENYSFAFKKGSELTAAFNTAIAELRADGTLDAITAHYITGEAVAPDAAFYQSPEGTEYPNGDLVMSTNAEFAPYEYYGADGSIIGLDADFAKAICDKLGYNLVIEDMSFDAVINAVQSDLSDFGAAALTVTEERLQNVDFSDSYCAGIQVIIVKK